jgi:DNA-binding phage protein
MSITHSGAYFHKTVGVTPKNTIEEQELAVAYLARNIDDRDELRELLDTIGLVQVARQMTEWAPA